MSLRLRLVLASGIVLLVAVVGAVAMLRVQRSFLVGQVDERLEQSQPFVRPVGSTSNGVPSRPPPAGSEDLEPPVSDLYVGLLVDGVTEPVLSGRLLDDSPDLDLDRSELIELSESGPFTVGGQTTDTSFRVAVLASPQSDDLVVIALPLDEVESTVQQLRLALGLGVTLIAAVVLLSVWWVERLGLRPIERLTAAADAVARGERQHRVDVPNRRTEAGRLSNAFNLMLDERDASDARLRQFVADASHELRTPLTSIRGYLDLYRQGGFRRPGDVDDVIRRMSQESSRMNDLVEDLLLLANLDQHRPLRHETVDLSEMLEDAASDARVLQPERLVTVDAPGAEAAIVIVGDRYRLQQVVSALVANALAYTDARSDLRLTVADAGDHVSITVADGGPGLSPADAARVFDRFFRTDQSRARRTGGSGLGLSIAKSIVEAHGGSIWLETHLGDGCRFHITLPCHAPPAPHHLT